MSLVTIIGIKCVWIILVFLYSKTWMSGFVRVRKWSSYFWCCTCLSMSLVTVIWINYINKLSLVFFPLKSEYLCLSGWENMVKLQLLLCYLSESPVTVTWIKFLYKLSLFFLYSNICLSFFLGGKVVEVIILIYATGKSSVFFKWWVAVSGWLSNCYWLYEASLECVYLGWKD